MASLTRDPNAGPLPHTRTIVVGLRHRSLPSQLQAIMIPLLRFER